MIVIVLKTCQTIVLPAHPDFEAVLFPEFPGQPEVDDPEVVVVPLLGEDDVERFQVEVEPTIGMNELDAWKRMKECTIKRKKE